MLRLLGVSLLFGMAFISGCSDAGPDQPELGNVHGMVTLNGDPLPGVTVYFKPDVGRPSMGKADLGGNYKAMYKLDVEGVKIGPNTVTVEWGTGESGPPIPPEYGSHTTLKLDVKPGDNPFNIDMISADESTSN